MNLVVEILPPWDGVPATREIISAMDCHHVYCEDDDWRDVLTEHPRATPPTIKGSISLLFGNLDDAIQHAKLALAHHGWTFVSRDRVPDEEGLGPVFLVITRLTFTKDGGETTGANGV